MASGRGGRVLAERTGSRPSRQRCRRMAVMTSGSRMNATMRVPRESLCPREFLQSRALATDPPVLVAPQSSQRVNYGDLVYSPGQG